MRLSAINSTSSAFCAFAFPQDFFEVIKLKDTKSAAGPSERKLECQLNIRSLLASLKTNSSGGAKLDRCELSITDDGPECRLSVRLHYQSGVVKTHRLTYEAQQAVFPSANPDPGSTLTVSAQTVQEWLMHFVATGRGADLSLWCGTDFCTVRSKSDDFEAGKIRKSIQTEVKVETEQFQLFQVQNEAFLTVPMREFKAAVTVAEALLAPLELHFSVGGDPLFVRVYDDLVQMEMVIATVDSRPPGAVAAETTEQKSTAQPRVPEAASGQTQTHSPQQSTASSVASQLRRHATVDDRAAVSSTPLSESQMPLSGAQSTARPTQLPRQSTPPQQQQLQSRDEVLNPQRESQQPLPSLQAASQHQPQHSTPTVPPPPRPAAETAETAKGDESHGVSTSQPSLPQTLFRGDVPPSTQDESASRTKSMPPPPTRKIARPGVTGGAQREVDAPRSEVSARAVTADAELFDSHDGGDVSYGDDFDYDGAFDEMERGVKDGSIPVHGSQQQQQQERKSEPAAATAAAGHKSIVLETEDDLLAGSPPPDPMDVMPATQSIDDVTAESDASRTADDSVEVKRFRPMFE